ncbi:MAG: hypothetical protein ACREXS_01955 [Gammaproteobacteria bacterium]
MHPTYDYPHPAVPTGVVRFIIRDHRLRILVIRREVVEFIT